MARHIFQGVTKDQNGRINPSATVSVYLAGTTTVASIYAASSGGTAVNSVTSNTSGIYSFYVDPTDYAISQLFKIIWSKTGYGSVTFDNIPLFNFSQVVSTDGTLATNSDNLLPTEKAVKTYTMPLSYLDTDGTLTANSDVKVPSQKAIKTYAQPKDATLTALAGVTVAADKVIYATGADAFSTTDFTSVGRSIAGSASASAARTTIGVAYSSEAEMEAGTEAGKVISPATVKHAPGVAKAWIDMTGTGTIAINGSYNVSGITDNGTGDYSIAFDIDFAGAVIAGAGSCYVAGGTIITRVLAADYTASVARIETANFSGTATDATKVRYVWFGIQ